MLEQAGFDAVGLELSPWIIDFAKKTFNVRMLSGPIEDQQLAVNSVDAVVMLDVMEHLPNPVQTLSRCAGLLKADGILLVQTPEFPAGKELAELHTSGHKFPQMLDPGEHLYLFSRASAQQLCRQVGLKHIEFIPAIFGFYDMSFVASREPIKPVALGDQESALARTNSGRMLQALLDCDARRLNLLDKYRAQTNTEPG